MRKLILLYLSIVGATLLATLLFLLRHIGIYGQYGVGDWLQVLQHSVPQDLTVAGYIVALPLVLKLVHLWLPGAWFRHAARWIAGVLLTVAVVLWCIDLELFAYWGFRLDATPMIYLLDNPAEALASAPVWLYLLGAVILALAVWLIAKGLCRLWPAPNTHTSHLWREAAAARPEPLRRRVMKTCGGVVLAGLCFVAIRGGVSESTMNVGRAYFSSEMMLNQAAVNPVFSFLYSIGKQKRYDQMYRFMSEEDCRAALAELEAQTSDPGDTAQRQELLNNKRPNVLLVILEGFSGGACTALTPEADPRVMPELTRLYDEGLGWTRFYANSWRTDRGVASILASYPAQPTTTVMKDQSKCNHLQYLPQRLKEAGYDLQFVYGGDVNFTNMLGFLRAGGIDRVVSMDDFSLAQKEQEWGVPDHTVYQFMYEQMKQQTASDNPWCKVMLTLSSHEPFDVPDFHRLEHPFANSYAYADSCLGAFVDRLKADALLWNDLLVVILPDHCSNYPEQYELQQPERYHIPMVWTGGALQLPVDSLGHEQHHIDALGQQTDLAATLLGQMELPHDDFNFSKDLLNPATPRFAFYDYPDGFGLLAEVTDSTSRRVTVQYMQDNQRDGVGLKWSDDPEGKAQRWGKAYLQHLMDDLSGR